MADLPSIPNTVPEVRAPTSRVSAAQIKGPYEQLAETFKAAGTAAEDVSISLATQAGYKAVTTDAEGNLQVEKAPIVGPAAKHYADAVKMSALAQGEGVVRREDIKLRQEYRDNPEGYRIAAENYAKEKSKQWADAGGPELGLALRKAIEPITTQTYKGLLNEKERLDLHRTTTGIDSEIEFTKNQMYAMARGGATDSPEFKLAASKVRALYGALGENPRLAYPQEKIRNELSEFDSELRVQGLAHHTIEQIYATKGYDEAAKFAATIRTDRSLNLSPQQRDTSYSRVMAELNSRARDDERVEKSIAGEIKSLNKMAIEGYEVPPERMGQTRAAVSAAKSPELAGALADTEAVAATMKQWKTMSPPQLEGSLVQLDTTMREKGASEQGLALRDAGDKLLKTMRKQVETDPLGWADRTGVMTVPPIGFGTPDAPANMRDRATRAEMIAQHYGVAPTYLRPDEKAALQVAAAKGGDIMLSLAKTLADGFGDRAPKVMGEISSDAPSLAHVGALVQSGGNPVFAVDVADAIKLRQDKEFKLPRWLDQPADKIMAAQGERAREVFGSAFALAPETAMATQKAAQDAFFTRANRNGYVPLLDNSESKKAYDRALQESAGAQFKDGTQYGGVGDYKPGYWTNYKVLVPASVKADRFKDTIGAITADDLSKMGISPQTADGRPYGPTDLRAAVPVATRNGYRFALGDPNSEDPKYIRGADGKPWVLDFGQMEERLRARVPGAFLGGR